MTLLEYNHSTGRYEARVSEHLIEVDADSYAEARRDHIKGILRERGLSGDLDELPEAVYDELYGLAEAEIEQAEGWMIPPMDGLFIDGVDHSES